jgi:murein DD-endopeptidase MepM/ murein hydrolase activator NlpD
MSQQFRGHHYRADSGRMKPSGPPHRAAPRTDYTIAHAGRQFRLGPVTFWIVVGSLVIMAGWSLATGSYFAFHDDVLTRLIARQKQQQFAYEDRIAELREQVDRIASRQLLDQEQVVQKLELIRRRQATLESRAAALAGMPDPTPTGSIKSRPTPIPEPPPGGPPKASPISDTVIFTAPPDREARLVSRTATQAAKRIAAPVMAATDGVEGTLARLEASLDRVETRQAATLDTLEERYDGKAKRMRSVLSDLGMDPNKARAGVQVAGMGGPFVPVHLRKDADPFDRRLYRVRLAQADVERLTHALDTVPVRKPLTGEIDLSSGFGVRSDPFLGRPAMHTGLDFRGSVGDPVHATAAGTVEIAGWSGGAEHA